MKFVVNGVEYNDYSEALIAESNTRGKERSSLVRECTKVFSINRGNAEPYILLVVAKNSHTEIAKALAEEIFGCQFEIDSNLQLRKNYIINECLDKRKLDLMLNTAVELDTSIGKVQDDNMYYFNNLDSTLVEINTSEMDEKTKTSSQEDNFIYAQVPEELAFLLNALVKY